MSVIKELDDSWLTLLFSKQQMKMALIISFIVGTILNLINQGHLLSTPEKINLVNIVLTYCVPYCVATLSSALSTMKHQKKIQRIEENKRICENNFLSYIASNVECLNLGENKEVQVSAESVALFLNQFETIEKLIQFDAVANHDVEFEKIKELISKNDLVKSLPILKKLVTEFADGSTEQLNMNKEKVALLSEQRTQLIEALKVL